MEHPQAFDLMGYIAAHLSGFGFGEDVLGQWTLGLRFNIGLEYVDRAVAIYEQAFGSADRITLISEDWPWDSDPKRWYPLFALPGLIRSPSAPPLTSCQPHQPIEDDDVCTLTWADLSPSELDGERLFQAIANQDHGRTPSVRGRIYILDPLAELLFHMYDDRGLDIVATSTVPTSAYERFGSWINRANLGGGDGWQK